MLLQRYLWLSFAFSIGALASALTAQYFFHFEPCLLCVWQRVPYFVILLLGIAGLVQIQDYCKLAAITKLIIFCFAIGAALAFYHVGVEQHWWKSTGCQATIAQTIEELRAQLYAKKITPCDQAAWQFAGLSMAAWNAIASFAFMSLGLFCGLKDRYNARQKEYIIKNSR